MEHGMPPTPVLPQVDLAVDGLASPSATVQSVVPSVAELLGGDVHYFSDQSDSDESIPELTTNITQPVVQTNDSPVLPLGVVLLNGIPITNTGDLSTDTRGPLQCANISSSLTEQSSTVKPPLDMSRTGNTNSDENCLDQPSNGEGASNEPPSQVDCQKVQKEEKIDQQPPAIAHLDKNVPEASGDTDSEHLNGQASPLVVPAVQSQKVGTEQEGIRPEFADEDELLRPKRMRL